MDILPLSKWFYGGGVGWGLNIKTEVCWFSNLQYIIKNDLFCEYLHSMITYDLFDYYSECIGNYEYIIISFAN